MHLNRLTRRAFVSTLESEAPGRYSMLEIDGHQVFCLEEAEQVRPWSLPWREVRRNPEAFRDPKLYKMSSRRTVVKTSRFGRSLFVKRSLVKSPVERATAILRLPKEARELLLAIQWRAAGILSPEPVMLALGFDAAGGFPARYLVTRPIPKGAISARKHFKRHGFADGRWEALAHYTAGLLAKGALHADFRADHVHFEETSGGDDRIWLIDLDGARMGRGQLPAPRLRRMLLQLFQSLIGAGLTEREARAFAAIALAGRSSEFDIPGIVADARAARIRAKELADADDDH